MGPDTRVNALSAALALGLTSGWLWHCPRHRVLCKALALALALPAALLALWGLWG